MTVATVKLGAQAEHSLAEAYQNSVAVAAGSSSSSSSLVTSLHIDVTDDAAAAGYAPMDLSAWAAALSNQATVTVRIDPAVTTDVVSKIHTSFLLAGLQANGEAKEENGTRIVTAVKAANSVSAPIKLWNMDDDDDLLIDEDNLLADSSNLLAPPPAMSAVAATDADDCAGREPCADCTCGRSENKAKQQQQQGRVETSACGKCHLGDAFRCASCPHLGKPAFKPGEEHLVLDLQDDL